MADRYWVGGTGNWSDTTHWSATSGGAGSAGVPGTTDNVIFDTSSSTASAAYTVTVNATANCLNFTMDGPGGGNKVTIDGTQPMNIYGDFILTGGTAGIDWRSYGTRTFFASSGSVNIDCKSISMWSRNVVFNKSGGTFTLLSEIYIYALSSNSITLTAGTLAPNGQLFRIATNSNFRTSINGFSGSSFYDLTLQNSGAGNKNCSFVFNSDITVSNSLSLSGLNVLDRLIFGSDTKGTARTITCNGTLTVTNADFQDITGAGSASWNLSSITGGSGDCGGNSGITFTTPTTTDCSAGTTWSTATRSVRVPLPQDSATFSGSSRTIIQNMPRIGSVNFTGSSGLTFNMDTAYTCYGSINFTNLTTLSVTNRLYTFEGRGSNVFVSAGKTIYGDITINTVSGTLNFQDNFLGTSGVDVILTSGTLTVSGNFEVGSFNSSNSNTRTINMGDGTWSILLGSSTTVFTLSTTTNLTFNAGGSTIKFPANLTTNTIFNGGGLTYNNIRIATTGSYSVRVDGNNTFNDFKINAGSKVIFVNSTTQTVSTFTATGSAGNLITLRNSSSTTKATLAKAGGGTISCDYMDVNYLIGSPADTWYMGTNSTDGGSNTNIYFTAPPSGGDTSNFFMFF